MASKLEERLKGRRFGPQMRQALELVASGCSIRKAAETAGLGHWKDLGVYAKKLGLTRRRVVRREPSQAESSAA